MTNKHGATASSIFIEFLSSEDIANTPIEELVEFVNKKSRKWISNSKMTTEVLQQAARDSYRLDRCLYEPLTTAITCSFNCIQAFDKELKAINKAGNRYLRYYLIESAGSVVCHILEYQEYYQKKLAKITIHHHKRALALTSRKLIRMIFGLLAKNQLYFSNRVD
ncbi:hypothetical protein [Clostridium coskatii]|uniref:Transposase IS116/IS110/IS902 family protein n=1 Tax=Clostridium coskatii TaxID=1705578 RepID=A0A166UNS8_9CLOT|nr:hypothetical protein [Clostridium coskatii]OAA95098.1 hypothetical protein WX73_01507 [Clostridium coskatii]OBR97554.1 hypothetical protein CLCOS_02690 [Clostridium coskatii]